MCNRLYSHSVPIVKAAQVAFEMAREGDVVLLDAREPEEYMVSHLPNAICVGYDDFEVATVEALGYSKDTKIIVYCSVGYRSEKVGEKLMKKGFTNVHNMYGGIFDWVNNAYPVLDANEDTVSTVHGYNKNWSKWVCKGEKVY